MDGIKKRKSGGAPFLPFKAPPRANLINFASLYVFQADFNQFRRQFTRGLKNSFVITSFLRLRGKANNEPQAAPDFIHQRVNLILHDISSIP